MPAPNDPAAPAAGGDAPAPPEAAAPPTPPGDPVVAPIAGAQAPQDSGAEKDQAHGKVQPYDFRHPTFLSPAELRRLRMRQEECIRALSARLSIYLRLEFSLQLTKFQTISYRKFATSAASPAHLTLFKAEPLRGVGILEVHPQLGMSIVDRLLGGTAQPNAGSRDFSEIETALLDQVLQVVLAEWCQNWADVQELHPTLLGHESNGQFLATAPHDTVMLMLEIEAKMAECTGTVRIAIPCSTLEPLIKKLGQSTRVAEEEPAVPAISPKWNRNFDEVPVPITAMWDDLTLTARDIANLKPGDILPLDPRSVRNVKLLLASTPKFEGSLGTTGGKWAVAVTGATRRSICN